MNKDRFSCYHWKDYKKVEKYFENYHHFLETIYDLNSGEQQLRDWEYFLNFPIAYTIKTLIELGHFKPKF